MMRTTTSRRVGFTLVEMLVICAVLAILASMLMFALYGASTQARADRTRAQITKINDLLMIRWDSYRTRPLPTTPAQLLIKEGQNPNDLAKLADARLRITWDLMRLELPDRSTDVEQAPVTLTAVPALTKGYKAKIAALQASTGKTWSGAYSNAECLYLILSSIHDGETNGLDFFSPSEIGDIDDDGVPEIHDGWGQPIMFLRWAPGHSRKYGQPSDIQSGDPTVQPDPFDPLGVYKSANHFALFPLIYSAGPDGYRDSSGNAAGYGIEINVDYGTTSPPYYPYYNLASGTGMIGSKKLEDGYDTTGDNISNHQNLTER